MSGKHSRHSPSPSSPISHHTSKLPKFLQKQSTRDRAKSFVDPSNGSPSPSSLDSSPSPSPPETSAATPSSSKHSHQSRKSSKLLGVKEKDEKRSSSRQSPDITPPAPVPATDNTSGMDEPPVIIEPISIARPRTRSERLLSSASDIGHPSVPLYASTSSNSRMGDLPTRLSGWFSHTFSTSSTDLSLPSLLSQSHLNSTATSPKGKGGSGLLTAAKHGKGHLDKAVRYLLDSDATPDKCTDPIWLLGVQHPGYEPPPPPPPNARSSSIGPGPRRGSIDSRRHSPSSFRSSTSSSSSSTELSQSQSSSKHPGTNWPPVFYADFTSRIWLTYRSHFTPIRDTRLSDLACEPAEAVRVTSSPTIKRWNWSVGGEKGWTSDAGWGCMLRTGQSLLANSLLHMHLGRDWRRPPYPVHTVDYATYVQIVTWFLDTPSPEAPFSVHRMALAGKELGKEVGQWFGPSTAAGAIKTLVHAFPEAGLGVSVATDGVVFQSDVYAASNNHIVSTRRHGRSTWGGRPVLVLLGIRLGLDGVNPIYYDTIKVLYTFPQSVGIAGGRPGSSYYFVGSQADSLFYLDPHHARPAVPLRPAPTDRRDREPTPDSDRERDTRDRKNQRSPNPNHYRSPTSPSSVRTGSSTFSYHAPISPSPLQQQFSTSTSSSYPSHPPTYPQSQPLSQSAPHSRWQSASQPSSPGVSSEMDQREFGGLGILGDGLNGGGLDVVQSHYVTAYTAADLKTFHCDRVRKMPLSGLDPSMLIGFLCKDEEDWIDFRRRVGDLSRTIFSVQDEPPTWPSDSDDNMGLESISEPDDMDMDSDEQEGGEGEQFFDTRSGSASTSSASQHEMEERGKSEEVETEEDPVDPITPGPGSRFEIGEPEGKGSEEENMSVNGEFDGEVDDFDDDIEDDWVDPTPTLQTQAPAPPPAPSKEDLVIPVDVPALAKGKPNGGKKGKKGKRGAQIAVPVPLVKIPSQTNQEPQEHYPFPLTQWSAEEATPDPQERVRNSSNTPAGKRMYTARARDGGRTQSGGVKGVLTED